MKRQRIWIDIVNPSHSLFFRSIIPELEREKKIIITLRDRAETVKLANQFGIQGRAVGRDHENPIMKISAILFRILNLSLTLSSFDYSVSFENMISTSVTKIRKKSSILLLDNDLKYKMKHNLFQDIESRIKTVADNIIIPRPCYPIMKGVIDKDRLFTYDGYKEDIYIADFIPDKNFLKRLPFSDYVIIRPESLSSFYVDDKGSIVDILVNRFTDEGFNIIYLPRDKRDRVNFRQKNVFIPKEPLDGLDLIYYSRGVLTGSGTMGREGAVMGKRSAIFFPNRTRLSVDEDLIKKKRMIHSRDPEELIDYFIANKNERKEPDLSKSRSVKNEVLRIINGILDGRRGFL